MLDYFLPLQAQRERAHRDLLVRDGIEESARSLGLPSPTVTVAAASPSMDGGGGASNGMTESAESGGNEGGVLQDSDDRDADDDVRFTHLLFLLRTVYKNIPSAKNDSLIELKYA